MFKRIKRIAIAATIVLAVGAPTAAYAKYLNSATGSDINWQAIQNAPPPPAANASVSSSQGFQWADAGIGAAGALVLVSAGSGTVLAHRRRTRHPLTG
jgi:hypothetical protein